MLVRESWWDGTPFMQASPGRRRCVAECGKRTGHSVLSRREPFRHHVSNRNPLEFPEPDEDSVARLCELYRPCNEKLFEVIGRDLEWNDH